MKYHVGFPLRPQVRRCLVLTDILIIFVLILLNGFLALSEMAVASSRHSRLRTFAEGGRSSARVALDLATSPGRFLSAVQIGITLVGLIAGAYSGTSLAEPLASRLESAGIADYWSDFIAFGCVMAVVTYASLVVGELVPKQIALRDPERAAMFAAPVMLIVSKIAWPIVALLEGSSGLLLRLIPGRNSDSTVTQEEIRTLIDEAEAAGVMAPQARAMMAGVMRLANRRVRAIMTGRQDVQWIDLAKSEPEIRTQLLESSHSRLPAAKGHLDALTGALSTKDVLDAVISRRASNLHTLVREVPVVLDSMTALQAMEILRQSSTHMLFVVDEYGGFQGVLTPTNFLEVIAGEFGLGEEIATGCVQREDGSWLVDGSVPVDEVSDRLGLPIPANREYHTAAGFTLAGLRHLPRPGDAFVYDGWRIEVASMDGRRIDKLLMSRVANPS